MNYTDEYSPAIPISTIQTFFPISPTYFPNGLTGLINIPSHTNTSIATINSDISSNIINTFTIPKNNDWSGATVVDYFAWNPRIDISLNTGIIPPGIWDMNFFANTTNNNKATLQLDICKYDTINNILTLISAGSVSALIQLIADPALSAPYTSSAFVPYTVLGTNEIIYILVSAINTATAANTNVSLFYQSTTAYSHIHTSITGVQGEKGDVGAKGNQGDTGLKGATGVTGATGLLTISGTNYSDYIFWNNATSTWDVGNTTIHIGSNAGYTNQQSNAIAIGQNTGYTNQQSNAIAIGQSAGYGLQGANAIAVGQNAGQTNQGTNAVAIGQNAGSTGQGANAVAIGQNAGWTGQGANSIAIGNNSNITGINNIFLNATGIEKQFFGQTGAFYVNPIRGTTGIVGNTGMNLLMYNTGTNEVQRNSWMTVDASNNVSLVGQMSATSFRVTSDYRIKDNVVSIPSGFSVDRLNPVYYQNNVLKQPEMGFLAHDVQEEYPFLVSGEKDGEKLQSLNYTGLIPLMVQEIKDLKMTIQRQNGDIQRLRIQMDELTNK